MSLALALALALAVSPAVPPAVAALPAAVVAPTGSPGSLDPTFDGDGQAIVDLPAARLPGEVLDVAATAGGTALLGRSVEGPFWLAWLDSTGALVGGGVSTFTDLTPSDLTVDGQGRTLVVGTLATGQLAARRWTTTRALDTTFDLDGTAIVPDSTGNPGFREPGLVVVGSTILLGRSQSGAVIVNALNDDGSPQTAFGGTGSVTVPTPGLGGTSRTLLAASPQGSVVVSLPRDPGNLDLPQQVARLSPAGSLDTTFSGDGLADLPTLRTLAPLGDLTVDAAGRVCAVGLDRLNTPVANRLTAAGAADTSFGSTGSIVLPQAPTGVVTDAADRLVVSMTRVATPRSTAQVARLGAANGALDTTFGGTGVVSPALGASGRLNDVALVPGTGGILVAGAGSLSTDDQGRAVVQALTPSGSTDTGFGAAGGIRLGQPEVSAAQSTQLAVTPAGAPGAGSIALAGPADDLGLVVARTTQSGAVDTTFSDDGWIALPVQQADVLELGVDGLGRVLVLEAHLDSAGDPTTRLWRLTAVGTLDAGFGTQGVVDVTAIGPAVTEMSVLPDGRVLLADTTSGRDVLARLTATGALDPTFDGDGRVTGAGLGGSGILALVTDSQGRPIVSLATPARTLARFTTAGALDATFGAGGLAALSPATGARGVYGRLGRGAGDALLALDAETCTVVRVSAAGQPDLTFGTGGRARIDVAAATLCSDALVDGSGRLLIAGLAKAPTDPDAVGFVARLTPTGLPDTTFTADGETLLPTAGGDLTLAASGQPLVLSRGPSAGAPAFGVARLIGGTGVPQTTTFTPLAAPARLLDTRVAIGVPTRTRPGRGATLTVQATGRGGVPAGGVTAVVLTVTAVDATTSGWVTAYPAGRPRPTASNLNITKAGQIISNQVIVPVSAGGAVSLWTAGPTHLIADVVGWFGPAATARAGRFTGLDPARLLDTRSGARPKAGQTLTLPIAGRAGVPTKGVSSVVVNVTATASAGAGWVITWPSGVARPSTSSLNLDHAGQTIAAHTTVRLGADGAIKLYTSHGTHLIVDVLGWYTDGTAAAGVDGLFVPVDPTRLFDTRSEMTRAPRGAMTRTVNGLAGVPARDVAAVVANTTAVNTAGAGWVTVYPASSATVPTASSLNMEVAGQTIANLVTARIPSQQPPASTDGRLVFNSTTSSHLIADIAGWYLAATRP